ncbi:glycoside hydrolase family 9 protein [candidate division KSB1 bacterium]|nr:glycoside hydrolase family 9 protein [candidate division KSB1 bacterium]
MKFSLIFLFLLFISQNLIAADLLSVLPLTDKILVLHFDEGHIDYFGIHQDRYNGNKIYYQALDLNKSTNVANYTISSQNDDRYGSPQKPVNIGRKSKGVDFNNIYDANEPKFISHHWIYIELPFTMRRGMTYKVTLSDLASNVNEYTFVYDEKRLRSPAVHVNQIGFIPNAPKYAYISHFMGSFNSTEHEKGGLNLNDYAQTAFHIIRTADDSVMFSGTIAKQRNKTDQDFIRTTTDFKNKNMTLADVWECDFSAFDVPGEYRVVVERMGCSYPFEISEDVYREAYYYTSRAMFTQRSGIIQEIEPGLNYPRKQHPDDGRIMKYYPDLTGEQEFDPTQGEGIVKDVWGWYHDAGDWDGYDTHYRVPMTLLALYDLKPQTFGDGDVNPKYKLANDSPWINEGENGIPDILDEAMWLIRFFKRAKDALIAQGLTDGGVPGYAGVDAGADGGKPSWEDTRVMALKGGNSVAMSYRYAACAAWLAICLDKFQGSTHSDSPGWIDEAKTAYKWAFDQNNDSIEDVNQAKMEAAAALYRYTGETSYQNDFKICKKNDKTWKSKLWFNINPWHYAATIFGLISDNHPGLDIALKKQCIDDIVAQANSETVQSAYDRGFRYGLDKDILFMLGTFSTPHTYLAAVAYEFTKDQKFLDACYTTCDYCLGGNQLDMVKISGLGENPEQQPFHPDSWYLIDYNSKVYTNPILPGYVIYEMYRTGDWMAGESWTWIGDEDFSRSTAYPAISNFPDTEARFLNRNSIAGSEFTIHQTQIMAIFGYGFLCANYNSPYIANTRPTIALNLKENQTIRKDTTVVLTVTASPDVRRVEYYYDWHFIGESEDKANDFAFPWNLSRYKINKGRQLITAKAFDDKGMESKPSDAGDVIVNITAATSVHEETGQHLYFELKHNYPNPFNPTTSIAFTLPDSEHTRLEVFNTLGELVVTLIDNKMVAGEHEILFNAVNLPSGIYYYKLQQKEIVDVKKLVVLK